jgi:hypothetical protein
LGSTRPLVSALPMPALEPADELARQIADVLATEQVVTIDELRTRSIDLRAAHEVAHSMHVTPC